jgi:hypothetical protein
MLNRIGAVVASASLITVSTLAFSGVALVALVRGGSNLIASNADYEQEHSFMSLLSDRFNSSLPKIADLSKPSTHFCYFYWNWCY